MKDDREKAEELLKKRRLAAKGSKERADGKPVDPLEDIYSLDPDDKHMTPDEPGIAKLPGVAAAALRKN